MVVKLPIGNSWTQPNDSDKFGSLWATKNINLDEKGYLKLSPRTVKLIDNDDNGDFGLPLALGQHGDGLSGSFQVATNNNAAFNTSITDQALAITENSGAAEPTLTTDSHGVFFQTRWWASINAGIVSKVADGSAAADWTSSGVTLTGSLHHYLAPFDSRNTLCASDGNVLKQYSASGASLSASTDLTLPSDYEIVGFAYNQSKLGVITILSSANSAIKEAKFFVWNGATTSAQQGYGVGSDGCIQVIPYKSTFVLLTRAGQLLSYNGGGLQELASLPFYFSDKVWSAIRQVNYPDIMTVDGDTININLGNDLKEFAKSQQKQLPNFPAGTWCYDPKVGLYHRWSTSNSKATLVTVNASGANATTNVITAASGTIPETGNVARMTNGTIGGLVLGEVYYVVKVTSSTFKLATSKANALAGTTIDITSTNGSTAYFYMYDLVDYGVSYYEQDDAGAIANINHANEVYQDVLIGADILSSALTSKASLCMAVPFLENRGWAITPRISSDGVTDINQRLFIKFRRLKDGDAIVVKAKYRDVTGLPISSPNNATTDELIWTSAREGYTTTDLSDAKTHLDNGGELEIEFVAGTGAGQMVQITEINESNGTYSLVFDESVIGASGGETKKSYFIIDNWQVLQTINTDSEANIDGIATVNVASKGRRFVQFKTELRGYETTIEEMLLTNISNQTS